MPSLNETFSGTVRGLTSDGKGVVEHRGGQIFFVAGVWLGEEGEFKVTGFKKRTGFARLVTLSVPSPQRVEPRCQHHGFGSQHCGGCPWQFVAYEAQLAAKQFRVETAMTRIVNPHISRAKGNKSQLNKLQLNKSPQAKKRAKDVELTAKPFSVEPIWASPEQWGYRNRAQLKSNGTELGYVAAGSNHLINVKQCPVLSEHNQQTLAALRQTLPNPLFKPKRKGGAKKAWTALDIDEGLNADSVSIDNRRPFRQANSGQNLKMQQWLQMATADVDKSALLLELFAGTGNFTEVLVGEGFNNIVAVEGVDETVAQLNDRALVGVNSVAANLFTDAGISKVVVAAKEATTWVLDPPRDGFPLMGELLKKSKKVTTIFYISCDLASFARDVDVLIAKNFTLVTVQPVDQFPHTPHVELLAKLVKNHSAE